MIFLRSRVFASLALNCCLLAGCASTRRTTAARAGVAIPNLYEAQRQVEQYIASGGYDADFKKVVAEAQVWMESRAKQAVKPAIVLDIDETSLSNWPAYRLNGWGRVVNGSCDLEAGPCGLRAWQALGQSKVLEPTRNLVRRAKELGVGVFFISARPAELQEATERNLKEQGYEWTAVVVLPPGAHFTSAADFKTPQRRKIAESGYTILLSMGDQDSDLAGGYAERTFKLPNPVYFLP